MQTLQGIAVSPGVAIGAARVLDNAGFSIARRHVPPEAVNGELRRWSRAVTAVSIELERNRDSVSHDLGKQLGAIFSAHLQMLREPQLEDDVVQAVQGRCWSAEYAVHMTLSRYAKLFQESDSPWLRERAHDIVDLEKGLLRHLLGTRQEELTHLTSPVIVLAHNLTPSETANLDTDFVLGFVTEIGGAGGHTAILARGLEIPAVVGTGSCLADVDDGVLVIVDGDQGLVIIDPDAETQDRYRREVEQHRLLAVQLRELQDLPAETKDGVRLRLLANIEFPYEAALCRERGADGIGLYRTEFLYLGSSREPSEDDHYRAYAEVVEAMQGRPVVIRTLDLGADKLGHRIAADEERNPFLGLRSIRVSLLHPELFRPQLRAILRVSVLGPVRVMFPLVSTLRELRQAKTVLAEVRAELAAEGVVGDPRLPVGMMVESPAAATLIDRFVQEVDFVSIGTNDLIQYTLAVDRTNPHVADLYQAADPAVLRLIQGVVRSALAAQVPTSSCGQMSSEPAYTMLLLGLGLRELSVPPVALLEIKKVCRSVTVAQCEALAAEALRMDHAHEIDAYLRDQWRRIT